MVASLKKRVRAQPGEQGMEAGFGTHGGRKVEAMDEPTMSRNQERDVSLTGNTPSSVQVNATMFVVHWCATGIDPARYPFVPPGRSGARSPPQGHFARTAAIRTWFAGTYWIWRGLHPCLNGCAWFGWSRMIRCCGRKCSEHRSWRLNDPFAGVSGATCAKHQRDNAPVTATGAEKPPTYPPKGNVRVCKMDT